jgi:hypothetical protein
MVGVRDTEGVQALGMRLEAASSRVLPQMRHYKAQTRDAVSSLVEAFVK